MVATEAIITEPTIQALNGDRLAEALARAASTGLDVVGAVVVVGSKVLQAYPVAPARPDTNNVCS